jgi:hypothetical protein
MNTPGSLDSPVVNTQGSLDSPVMNNQGVDFFVYLEQASEQVYKKLSGDRNSRERLFSVLITGEFRLPDVYCTSSFFWKPI